MLPIKRHRVRAETSTVAAPSLPVDSESRIAMLAHVARERLAEWAAVPLPDGLIAGMRMFEMQRVPNFKAKGNAMMNYVGAWMKAYRKVGEHEGCGTLLLVAKVDLQGTGSVSKSEMQQLFRDVEMRAEQVLGFVTTVMIVCTLSLAVTVPLIIWPLSTSDGVVDSKTHLSPSLGGSWPGGADWYAAWLGSDALAVVHWVEVIMLVLSIYNALKGTLIGVVVYSNLAIYSPDTESKLYCMFDTYAYLSEIIYNALGTLTMLYFGITLLCARTCPLACLALVAGFVLMGVTMGPRSNFTPSLMIAPALNQLRIAREILHEANGEPRHMAEATPVTEFRPPVRP